MRSPNRNPETAFALAAWLPLAALLGLSAGCTREPKVDEAALARLSLAQRVRTLDPALADDTHSMSQVGLAYEGLLGYHFLKRPYELAPALAERVPEPKAGGASYVFHLRKGVLFQDDPCFGETRGKGREVTAEDVVYTLKRIADPKVNSPAWWLFDGKIRGLNEWRGAAARSRVTNYATPVEGLEAVDRYTLRIRLTGAYPLFLHYLATSYASVVPREAVERYGEDFARKPVGTGPFRLIRDKSSMSSLLLWGRNPTYRGARYPDAGSKEDRAAGLLEDAGKPTPFLERLEVAVTGESEKALSTFREGMLDLLPLAGEQLQQVMPEGKELAPEFRDKGYVLVREPAQDLVGVGLNLRHPVLAANRTLRQALSLAFDGETFNELFYGGYALPAQGPIPPGLTGHLGAGANPFRRFSVTEAKKMLRKAGYPGGMGLPELTFAALGTGAHARMAEFIQRAFQEIGVNLRIETYGTWAELLASVKAGKSHLWIFAWSADYPDPENFLQLYYGKHASAGPNDSGYSNPAFDALFEKLQGLEEGARRKEAVAEMVELLKTDVPAIWGVHRIRYALAQPWVRNAKPHAFDHAAARFLRVDGPVKARARPPEKP